MGQRRCWRILVVDDHADTRNVLARLLARLGHVVTTAADANEARSACAADRPDLVISDLGLPDRAVGLALVRSLRADRIPCVVLSGHVQPSDGREIGDDGGCSTWMIAKPASIDAVTAAIDAVMA